MTNRSRIVRVGLTQMACGPDPKRNRARQVALVEQAAKKGAQIVCTQELFASQYFCQIEDHRFFALAETIPGPEHRRALASSRRSTASSSSRRCSSGAPRASTTTRRR